MAVVALLDPVAQLGEILVGVDHAALDGLRRPRVVPAIVERHPTALEIITLLELRPGHPTAHPDLPLPPEHSGLKPGTDIGVHRPPRTVKEGVWHESHN